MHPLHLRPRRGRLDAGLPQQDPEGRRELHHRACPRSPPRSSSPTSGCSTTARRTARRPSRATSPRSASWSPATGRPSPTRIRTYDAYGRELTETDAVGTQVTTAYLPATGTPATEVRETNALGYVDRTFLEPAWGEPVAEIDANNRRTDMEHDALGRLVKVWQSDRSKAAGQSPSTEYSYLTRNDGPNVVTSRDTGAATAATPSATSCTTACPGPARPRSRPPATSRPRTRRCATDAPSPTPSTTRSARWPRRTPATSVPASRPPHCWAWADTDVPNQVASVYDGTGEGDRPDPRGQGRREVARQRHDQGRPGGHHGSRPAARRPPASATPRTGSSSCGSTRAPRRPATTRPRSTPTTPPAG